VTVFLFAAGGLFAGLGTRASAALFVAAAVFGARQPEPLIAAVCTWTAAAAAGWVLLERGSPRAAALPCLGAAAVLAAAGSPNGAVVLGLWVLGTVAVVLQRGELAAGRRWAIALAAGDVVFAVAIATTAGRGFEGWPATLKLPGALAMLVAAVMRAPLAGGSAGAASGSYPACLIVRAQTVVLVGLAVAAGDRTTASSVVVLGAFAFASSSVASRRETVDAVQELGLVAIAVGAAELGWVPAGWAWGALAAGTLIHHLRFTVDARPPGPIADAIGRGAGIGLPFLPVATALLEGAYRTSSRLTVVVLLGLLAGLAGRTRISPVRIPRTTRALDPARAWGPIALAGAASLAAPLLWSPSPPAGGEAAWPPVWAAVVVIVAAVVGSQVRNLVAAPPRAALTASRPAIANLLDERLAMIDAVATDVVLWAAVTAVAAAAVVLWLVGLGRGFL
jgi:hypothetical protein